MKKRLDQLTIENFRIFKDPVSFKFSDITVFTGANNSGKSTVIKAIKLFIEGVETSDFPMINLLKNESDIGRFADILNFNSKKKYFSIGFPIRIGEIPDVFNLVYTFTDGLEARDHFRDTAIFADLEIIDSSGKVFFGIYSEDVLGYDDLKAASIDFPSDSGEPGLLRFRLNLDLLEKYLRLITPNRFIHLRKRLKTIMGNDHCWWGECFHEGQYSLVNYDISKFSFADFETELNDDFYFNLATYNLKKKLFFENESDDEDYLELKKTTRYPDFIKLVIHPILQSIKSGLNLFRNQNILYISPENIQERLINSEIRSEYLQTLSRVLDNETKLKFIREALAIFNIDGLIEIIPHLTSSFEINLIIGAAKTLQKIKDIKPKLLETELFFNESLADYSENKRINIADLGKGATNIIKLVLKTASILFSVEDEHLKLEILPKRQGRRPKSIIQKTILIEEPEAFLHPNWQSCLADFFIYCKEKYDVQFIIETHSEYMLRKLQFRVAQHTASVDTATIYYFNNNEIFSPRKKQIEKISILEDGSLDNNFGPGFFDEATNWQWELMRLKKSQKN